MTLVASVIVPHLNTPDLLERCLASVTSQIVDGDFEVIVVDNGSTVSLDAVRAAFPTVRWLDEPCPGPGLARNRGAAAAGAPILVFIDADCRAAPGWLAAAVAAIAPDPARNVAGGEIVIDTLDPERFTGMEAYETVFGFRQRRYIEVEHFSVTANLAMGAAVLAAVGPFGGIEIAEDHDWGRRAWSAGYPTHYVPAMRVAHPARPDLPSMARKWQRLISHERRAHVAKNAPEWRWQLRAAALVGSVPIEAFRLLASPRLPRIGDRLRGIAALAQIRAFRAAEMCRVARGEPSGAMLWNR